MEATEHLICNEKKMELVLNEIQRLYESGVDVEVEWSGYYSHESGAREEWRDVPGYEERFMVSNYGRVWSKPRPVGTPHKSLRNKTGRMVGSIPSMAHKYRSVTVRSKDRINIHQPAHRLVALAFLPNPKNLPVVNHKNGVKSDNRVENLEWCTQKENMNHAMRMGLWDPYMGPSRLKPFQVLEIRELLSEGVPTKSIAKQYSVCRATIDNIRNGKTWGHIK